MRLIYTLALAAILTGCDTPPDATGAYMAFLDEHGTDAHYYCDTDTGFLMLDSITPDMDSPVTTLVTNGSKDPVECPGGAI